MLKLLLMKNLMDAASQNTDIIIKKFESFTLKFADPPSKSYRLLPSYNDLILDDPIHRKEWGLRSRNQISSRQVRAVCSKSTNTMRIPFLGSLETTTRRKKNFTK